MMTRIVLSFDDGREDNFRIAKEVLLPRSMKATFNITTGYINGNILASARPCDNPAMQISDLQELNAHNEFEIAGHGNNHLNAISDWEEGICILRNWLGNQWNTTGVGIASPHSELTINEILKMKERLNEMNVMYVRTGLANQSHLTQRIISRIARAVDSKVGFFLPIKSSLHTIGNHIYIYSIPILHQHSLEQVIYLINKCVLMEKDCVLMFHSVLKPKEKYYDNLWTWDYLKFLKLCDFLFELREKGNISIVTTKESFIYREK